MEKYLNGKGRQIIGWDEILEGGLAPNATVMSWRGEEGGKAAIAQQHRVIMTPETHCYFDYYQSLYSEEGRWLQADIHPYRKYMGMSHLLIMWIVSGSKVPGRYRGAGLE